MARSIKKINGNNVTKLAFLLVPKKFETDPEGCTALYDKLAKKIIKLKGEPVADISGGKIVRVGECPVFISPRMSVDDVAQKLALKPVQWV